MSSPVRSAQNAAIAHLPARPAPQQSIEFLEPRRLVAEMFFTLPQAAAVIGPAYAGAALAQPLQASRTDAAAGIDASQEKDFLSDLSLFSRSARPASGGIFQPLIDASSRPFMDSVTAGRPLGAMPRIGLDGARTGPATHNLFSQVQERGFGIGEDGERLTETDPMLGFWRSGSGDSDGDGDGGRGFPLPGYGGNLPPSQPPPGPQVLQLNADANRDGVVDHMDLPFKGGWGTGPDSGGALVLPNSDMDGNTGAPDNWRGGVWRLNGPNVPANNRIDGNGDLEDLAPLMFSLTPLKRGDIPSQVTIQVNAVAGEHSYFNQFAAHNRVRIFMPTDSNMQGHLVPKVGDVAIVGPEAGAIHAFTGASLDTLMKHPQVQFAVEGTVPGATVDITVKALRADSSVISQDRVRMRVAPFVISDHTMPIDLTLNQGATPNQKSVTVVNHGSNSDLRSKLNAGFGTNLGTAFISDVWIQDGFERGYAKAPYGEMPMILELPRGRARGAVISDYIRGTFAGKDVAIDTTIQGNPTTFDSGGNLESIPHGDGGPAYFFHGQAQSSFQTQFFAAQGVNPMLPVNTSWLYVGHVDEVISVLPSGQGAMVADPELAWAMVQWAASINPSATMHTGMNSGTTTVGAMASNTTLWNYNKNYSLQADRLPAMINAVKNAMGLELPVSTPVSGAGNSGSIGLTKGGAFVAFFGDNKAREYELNFTSSTNYTIRWRHAPTDSSPAGAWSASLAGSRSQDAVFPAASAYVMSHWFTGTAAAGDRITFRADPNAGIIPMPQLFRGSSSIGSGWSYAYTTNHTNLLSALDTAGRVTAYTGFSYGPLMSYLPGKPSNASIFDDYVQSSLLMGGYQTVTFADGRLYHNGIGNIHCGTNDLRVVPTENWWDFNRGSVG